VVCSPAIRALQTAEALSYKIQTIDSFKPSATLTDVLQALSELNTYEHILIVGHQPWLGQLVSFLFEQTANEDIATTLNSPPKYNNTSIKKGAVWWLRLRSNETSSTPNLHYKLFTIQTPSLL
jgi:phosphohistidine phosphatase